MRRKNDDIRGSEYMDDTRPAPDRRRYVIGLGWLILALVILVALAPQAASLFLTISRESNPGAYANVMAAFADETALEPLPTYTPPPTYTPLPTYTPMPTATNTPTPTPIPPALIIQQLESKAQLVVVSKALSKRGFHVGVKSGLCSHGADFNAHGIIEAGIDFEAVDADSVSYDAASQTYALRLPAPEYTSCRIEYIRLVENSFSICNPDFDRARQFAEIQVMNDLLEAADEDGLIADARQQSALVLGDFVRQITGKRVEVSFERQGSQAKRDESCQPSLPVGWRYDRINDVWRKQDGR